MQGYLLATVFTLISIHPNLYNREGRGGAAGLSYAETRNSDPSKQDACLTLVDAAVDSFHALSGFLRFVGCIFMVECNY